jgi:peptidyl-prolyl cis-trans isomerase B (cyclophilin B)
VGTDKRERKKANRAARLEQEQRQAKRRGLIRRLTFFAVVIVGVLGLALLFNLLAGDDPEPVATGDTETEAEDQDPAADPEEEAGLGEAAATTLPRQPEDGECPPEDASGERVVEFDQPPPLCIDPAASYIATVTTNLGEFTIELDPELAPATVNNFVFLARHNFYDGVDFHRIVPGFVVQGGDATGEPPGTGGPGYTIDDELPPAGAYELGSLAMANSGPDTNGSQFFIVTGPDGTALPPLYSLFGQVVAGMDVVMAIEATGDTDEEAVIEDVAVSQV